VEETFQAEKGLAGLMNIRSAVSAGRSGDAATRPEHEPAIAGDKPGPSHEDTRQGATQPQRLLRGAPDLLHLQVRFGDT
jgi:hypothetical protein